ncbi:MAG: glycosyltransferase family 4 protein [Deltaproteobacteria bacterium]|nr:glycosyltransferase family 4 protein [Deltaproteobacteria bacterium]
MLAKELVIQGHEAYLLGPAPFNRSVPKEMDGVKLLTFRTPFFRYVYPTKEQQLIITSNARKFGPMAVFIPRWFELDRLVTKIKPDFMVVNRSFPDTGFPALMTHWCRRVPLVYDWDDLEGLHGFASSFKTTFITQLAVTISEVAFARLCSVTLTASRFLEDFALKLRVPRSRVFYAPTVADADRFRPDISGDEVRKKYGLVDKTVLLYAGNLEDGNGVKTENIIYAAARLMATRPDLRLLVVGGGNLLTRQQKEGMLPHLARELGILDKVVFTGNIPYNEMPYYLAAADLCLALFPINVITMAKSPLKVYEYMAAGKPVVARSIGEIPGAIQDGYNGWLVFSDDPAEYADKIDRALENRDLLQEIGKQARKTVEQKFLWRHSAQVLLDAVGRGQ